MSNVADCEYRILSMKQSIIREISGWHTKEYQSELRRMEQQISALKAQNTALQNAIDAKDTDVAGLGKRWELQRENAVQKKEIERLKTEMNDMFTYMHSMRNEYTTWCASRENCMSPSNTKKFRLLNVPPEDSVSAKSPHFSIKLPNSNIFDFPPHSSTLFSPNLKTIVDECLATAFSFQSSVDSDTMVPDKDSNQIDSDFNESEIRERDQSLQREVCQRLERFDVSELAPFQNIKRRSDGMLFGEVKNRCNKDRRQPTESLQAVPLMKEPVLCEVHSLEAELEDEIENHALSKERIEMLSEELESAKFVLEKKQSRIRELEAVQKEFVDRSLYVQCQMELENTRHILAAKVMEIEKQKEIVTSSSRMRQKMVQSGTPRIHQTPRRKTCKCSFKYPPCYVS